MCAAKVDDNSPIDEVRDWRALASAGEPFARLHGMARAGKLPQVLLITGRAGIGKRLFAAAIAASEVCTTKNACGTCGPCREVMHGYDPDVFWLEASEGSYKVDDAARFQEHLSFLPEGRSQRVAVIVDCERLTEQSTNRLLKTLEEPPASARIILTTSKPRQILPTVLSRTVVWRLSPPPTATTFEAMREDARRLLPLFDAAKPEAVLDAADDIARQGAGAIALADACEIILNDYYRSLFRNGADRPPPLAVQRRRELLQTLRALAGRGKVPLNVTLAAESLALRGRFGR